MTGRVSWQVVAAAKAHRQLPEALRMVADGKVMARLSNKTCCLDGAGVLGRVVWQAIADGLVEHPRPEYRRRVVVELTEAGRAALAARGEEG